MAIPALVRDRFRQVSELVTSRRVGGEKVLLEIDLTRGLLEAAPSSPLAAVRSMQTPTLRSVIAALESASEDDDVVGVVAHIGEVPLSAASELRGAIAEFRATGRATHAWAETYGELGNGNAAYLLASAFETVWVQPTGQIGLVGAAAQVLFLRRALDKLGVETQIGQRYEYKSAANRFTESAMTDPHREMMTRLVTSITDTLVTEIAASRDLAPDAVRDAVNDAPLNAVDAVERGLVDRIGYRDDVYDAVRGEAEKGGHGEVTLKYAERYGKSSGPLAGLLEQLPAPSQKGKGVIAVVGAHGPIHLGRNGGSNPLGGPSIGSDSLSAALRSAGRDEDVRAIVLRIDSPGGSAVASDAVRHALLAVRAGGTPVVASMGSLAASGGYYIAMPCDQILATPATLTGSIGVVAGKQILGSSLRRIGIDRETVSAGRYADMFSSDRPFNDDEWARMETWLDDIYDDFTAKAAEDRRMDVDELRALARGRVWTGADAADNGLVDALGGLQEAVRVACDLAGTKRDDVEVRSWPKPNPFSAFTPAESSEAPAAALLRGAPGGALGGVLGGLLTPEPYASIGEGDTLIDRLLAIVSAQIGVPTHGVLSMPWHIRVR